MPKENQNNGLTKYRVDELERHVNQMDENITRILTNHLPHLSEDMISLKTRINVQTAIQVGAIIVGIIVAKYLQ